MGQSLYNKILDVLSTIGCDECCKECLDSSVTTDRDCSECSIPVRFNPETGNFECPKGHNKNKTEKSSLNSYLSYAIERSMLDRLYKVLSEYAENRKVKRIPKDELPLYIEHKFRFDSSREILEKRLKK